MIEQIQVRQEFAERAAATVAALLDGERNIKQQCLSLHQLHVEFVAAGQAVHEGTVYTSFFAWMEALGLKRASASNYLNAGYALRAGLDPDGTRTLTELYDLGSALRHGATVAEAQAAENPATLAEARRNAGLIRLAVPEMFGPEADSLAERMMRLELAPAKPEALGLAIIICNTLTDTELSTLAARQTD